MKIHCIRHEPFEGPGNIELWIKQNGHTLSYTRTYMEQRFPDEINFDMLIIMGGTLTLYESLAIPWVKEEIEFINKVIKARKAVLGICLGSQILAHIYGARVYRNSSTEIGWFPIQFNNTIKDLLPFLPNEIEAFHWHGDTYDIPQGAIPLASSKTTINQGFLIDQNILALQFHLEMNHASLKKLIRACEIQICAGGVHVQSVDEILSHENFEPGTQLLNKFLNYLASTTSR